jgi:hypothetical protein
LTITTTDNNLYIQRRQDITVLIHEQSATMSMAEVSQTFKAVQIFGITSSTFLSGPYHPLGTLMSYRTINESLYHRVCILGIISRSPCPSSRPCSPSSAPMARHLRSGQARLANSRRSIHRCLGTYHIHVVRGERTARHLHIGHSEMDAVWSGWSGDLRDPSFDGRGYDADEQ